MFIIVEEEYPPKPLGIIHSKPLDSFRPRTLGLKPTKEPLLSAFFLKCINQLMEKLEYKLKKKKGPGPRFEPGSRAPQAHRITKLPHPGHEEKAIK